MSAWKCRRCGWLNADDAKQCVGCDKRRPRAKSAKPQPSFRPWRCVILALDAGDSSGWSIWAHGKLASSGETRIYTDAGVREVARVVDTAHGLSLRLGDPWVAFYEATWGGRMGMIRPASVGYWTHALRNEGLPMARIGSVYPARWRARVLPKGHARAKRDEVRRTEVQTARAFTRGRVPGNDEAPAILIGKWASHAGETGELLPAKLRNTV